MKFRLKYLQICELVDRMGWGTQQRVNAMSALQKLQKYVKPGRVYRRVQLALYSNAVDRHLNELVDKGVLQKLAGGIYYCPKKSEFGDLPPDEEKLIGAFLQDEDFLVRSLNVYNALGLGTTQLYNEKLVYNHKRDGRLTIGGRKFYFIKSRKFPKKKMAGSEEFMLVDLVNNLHLLAEDEQQLRLRVQEKTKRLDQKQLMRQVVKYGCKRTQKFFMQFLDVGYA